MKKSLSIATAAAVAGYRSKSSGTGCSIIDTSSTLDVFGDGSCKAFYKLDGNANDESGTYNGTGYNITYSTGKFGQAAVFNGTSYISATQSNLNTIGQGSVSVSCWVKPNSLTGVQDFVYLGSGASNQFHLGFNSGNLWGGSGTGGDWGTVYFNSALSTGVWYYITMVLDRTNKSISAYKDSNLIYSGTFNYIPTATTSPILIGTQDGIYNNFNGSIDQVRIFNRALTSAEVSTLYNEKKVPSVLKTFTETEMENVPVNNTTKADVQFVNNFNTAGWDINAFNTITPVAGDPLYLMNGSVIIKVNEPCMMYSIFTDIDSEIYWHKYNILMSSDNGSTFNIPIDSYDVGTSQNIWYKSSTILQPGYYRIMSGTIEWRRCDNAWFFKKANNSTFIDTCDPYWSKTSLLLSGDGTNGSQSFTDLTGKNTITAVGNAQISTSNKKFGTGSMYFDGNGDYVTISSSSNFNFGSGDFTIEGWMYNNGRISTYPCLFSNSSVWPTNSALSFFAGHNSWDINKYYVQINGTSEVVVSNISIIYNQWAHFAIIRSSGVIKLYINGTSVGSYTYSGNIKGTGDYIWIGCAGDSTWNSGFNGYIDDLRVTKGIARYTSNFTVPTKALPTQGI